MPLILGGYNKGAKSEEAALQKGINDMKNKVFLLSITALLAVAILTGCYAGAIDNPEFTEAPNGATVINEDTAKRAALEQAKLAEEEVSFDKVELDSDEDGEYEVDFIYDGFKYEVDVDATDGSIKGFDKEKLDKTDYYDDDDDDDVIPSDIEVIGEDAAIAAALAKAELEIAKEELTFIDIELDADDGKVRYEIDFIYNEFKYEMTVDAVSGEVYGYEVEAPRGQESSLPENRLSKEDVLKIALEHAKLAESDVSGIHIKLDEDDGRFEYEVEFVCGYDEYDYDIDAENGKIINFDREGEHCSAPEVSTPDASELIGKDAALAAAIKHAGVDSAKVYDVDVEYDGHHGENHHGNYVYEVEFKCGNTEYDYDINAFNGEVIRYESEIDD